MAVVSISALGPLRKKLSGVQDVEIGDGALSVRAFIESYFEELITVPNLSFVINGRIQKNDYILNDGDKIVVLKPGGAG